MPDTSVPAWVDDLFSFPTPAAFAALVDIAWRHATRDGYYWSGDVSTYYGFMFDLASSPAAPAGWPAEHYDQPGRPVPRREPPLWAPPEFETFGTDGHGSAFGWVIAAPELGRNDHPVGQVGPDEPGVFALGRDTRAGLEFLLSRAMHRYQERGGPDDHIRQIVDVLSRELDLHPDPRCAVLDRDASIEYDVPEGWRHEESADGVGVLAPADAFADRDPIVDQDVELPAVVTEVTGLLAAGYPATSLLDIRDTFYFSIAVHGDGNVCLSELAHLWKRAYRDLGRPHLAEAVDSIYC